MAGKQVTVPFKVGDLVRIRHDDGQTARVVELRGPLGPGGAQVYRVRVRGKLEPVYIELCEDQMVLIPPRKA